MDIPGTALSIDVGCKVMRTSRHDSHTVNLHSEQNIVSWLLALQPMQTYCMTTHMSHPFLRQFDSFPIHGNTSDASPMTQRQGDCIGQGTYKTGMSEQQLEYRCCNYNVEAVLQVPVEMIKAVGGLQQMCSSCQRNE